MSELNAFHKEMVKHLHHLLLDESPYEPSVDGDTIADATSDFICACEEFGIEEEALEFVKNNKDLKIEDLDEFFDSIVPPPEIVDSEEID